MGDALVCAYEGASPNDIVNRTTMKNANDEEEIPLDILAADPPAKLYLLVGTNALASGTKDAYGIYAVCGEISQLLYQSQP